MKNKIFCRVLFYAIGLLVLALGLTLNTKTGLGVSPIISVAYSISEIFDHNFGNMTLALYSVFVVIEMVLHLIRERRYSRAEGGVLANAGRKDLRLILLMDFLQIPLSIVFTRFLNVFSAVILGLYSDGPASPGELAVRVVFLIIAIILTGIGAAMSLNMRIVPNPGDGIVQAIADTVRKSVGFTKNCFDLTNIRDPKSEMDQKQSFRDRAQLFLQYCRRYGLETPEELQFELSSREDPDLALKNALKLHTPDFIFCNQTYFVMNLYEACSELGERHICTADETVSRTDDRANG